MASGRTTVVEDYEAFPPGIEYPIKADLRKDVQKPLPVVTPGTIDPAEMVGDKPAAQARAVLHDLNSSLASGDVKMLASLFHEKQTFWKDVAALTNHHRTFTTPNIIATALAHVSTERHLEGSIEFHGAPQFIVVNPVLMFIDMTLSFRTRSPALNCMGKMFLLSTKNSTTVSWKIWVLTTWTESLVQHPPDQKLLVMPDQDIGGSENIKTDVFILGAGSSGLMTAAQLKALGVKAILADRNDKIGDSWLQRYDCLRFHLPTSMCELPYAPFPKEFRSPHLLTKYEVAEHLRRYTDDFYLNVILSAKVQSVVFDASQKIWTIKLKESGKSKVKTITCKYFVQATGFGSGKPYMPAIPDDQVYKGIAIHSTQYRNTQELVKKGVKSVAIIGSATAAFDITQDCYKNGLAITMVARSPTWVYPFDYVMNPHSLGAYDILPLDVADRRLNMLPQAISGRMVQGLFSHLASREPDRYAALVKAGFPTIDSRDPSTDLQHHLIERNGGHYLDVGGTDLIADGKVQVRGFVEPIAYTTDGLRLSDNSLLTADAVIWCTGYADKDARLTASESFGSLDPDEINGKNILSPQDIPARLDALLGVDEEGEVRGMAKRHLRLENYWIIGGGLSHQRWWSKHMVQQIKLSLEGSLPPAYRDTPVPQGGL
ncbi:hypothetical protein F5Y16DRAFT_101419 [Xylariaceae sp. FL0255]|nr:hypothetical protein F5Y16DRAFT_101419 [Xylariaceae sp. FL0255]